MTAKKSPNISLVTVIPSSPSTAASKPSLEKLYAKRLFNRDFIMSPRALNKLTSREHDFARLRGLWKEYVLYSRID